jgi:hypothetical protein
MLDPISELLNQNLVFNRIFNVFVCSLSLRSTEIEPGVVMHAGNPSTREAEIRGSKIQGQPWLASKTLPPVPPKKL